MNLTGQLESKPTRQQRTLTQSTVDLRLLSLSFLCACRAGRDVVLVELVLPITTGLGLATLVVTLAFTLP